MRGLLEDYGWLAWLGVALALGAVEAATVDLVFLMLAGGALGGAAAAGLGAPFALQAVAAVLTAGLLLGVVRPVAKKRFLTPDRALMGTASYAGREGTVIEEVTDTSGRVRIGGETWSARGLDQRIAHPGDRVTVVRIEGATAVVAPGPGPGAALQDAPAPASGD